MASVGAQVGLRILREKSNRLQSCLPQREFSDETGDRAGELVERERNCRADAVGQELAMHLEVAPEWTIKQVRTVTMT